MVEEVPCLMDVGRMHGICGQNVDLCQQAHF